MPSSDNLKSKNSWWLQKLTLRIILHTYTNHQTWSFGCRNMNLTKHFNVSIIPTPPTTQLHLSTSTPASVRMSLVPDFNISWLHFKLYPFIGHNLQWNCYNFRPEHCGRSEKKMFQPFHPDLETWPSASTSKDNITIIHNIFDQNINFVSSFVAALHVSIWFYHLWKNASLNQC